jgi:hypothetical protein
MFLILCRKNLGGNKFMSAIAVQERTEDLSKEELKTLAECLASDIQNRQFKNFEDWFVSLSKETQRHIKRIEVRHPDPAISHGKLKLKKIASNYHRESKNFFTKPYADREVMPDEVKSQMIEELSKFETIMKLLGD